MRLKSFHSEFLIRASVLICILLLIAICSFSQTVYVTNTESKYHMNDCRYLSKSKIAMKMDDVIKGYTACSVCKPSAASPSVQGHCRSRNYLREVPRQLTMHCHDEGR